MKNMNGIAFRKEIEHMRSVANEEFEKNKGTLEGMSYHSIRNTLDIVLQKIKLYEDKYEMVYHILENIAAERNLKKYEINLEENGTMLRMYDANGDLVMGISVEGSENE